LSFYLVILFRQPLEPVRQFWHPFSPVRQLGDELLERFGVTGDP
jgi:hypothetical protein